MLTAGAIATIERRVLRRSRFATVLVTVVVALSAGTVMAMVAGGRRAATSYDRFIAYVDGADAETLNVDVNNSDEAEAVFDAIAALPPVASVSRSMQMGDAIERGGVAFPRLSLLPVTVDFDDAAIGRTRVLSGRLPHGADEAVVDFATAERFDFHRGDEVTLRFDPVDDDAPAEPQRHAVRIVGVIAYPYGFPSINTEPQPVLLLDPTLRSRYPDHADWVNGGLQIKLHHGAADLPALRGAIAAADLPVEGVGSVHEDAVGVRRLVRIEAGALWFIAVVVAGATLVTVAQLLRRSAAAAAGELEVLQSMGLTRREVALTGARHGLLIGAAGTLGAAAAAVLVSPWLPRGLARKAEVSSGIHADLLVLGLGALATIVFVVATSAATAALAMKRVVVRRRTRPSGLGAFTRSLPIGLRTGSRMALEPAGAGAARGIGMLGLATILLLLVGTVSLQASFERIVDEPDLSGSTWDMTALYFGASTAASGAEAAAVLPAVAAVSAGGWIGLSVNGKRVYATHFDGGAIPLAIDRGRAPTGDHELALGEAEMDALGVDVGDTVDVGIESLLFGEPIDVAPMPAKVTGRVILASPRFESIGQGEGAAITNGMLRDLLGGEVPVAMVFVRLSDRAHVADGSAGVAETLQPDVWFSRSQHSGVSTLRGVRGASAALLAVLGILAGAALVHRLVVTARGHRRQLAIMRSLGLTRGELLTAGAAHGATVVLLGLGAALPLGIVAATLGWGRIADYIGVVPRPAVAVVATVLTAVLVVAAGAVTGLAVTARRRRTPPGVALRAE